MPLRSRGPVYVFCGFAIASGLACAPDDGTEGEPDLGMSEAELVGGTATTARPEIGWFTRGCTATLIAPRYALTAAHCLGDPNYQDTTVRPGLDRFEISPGSPTHSNVDRLHSFGTHFTEKIWNGLSSDIALIRLDSAVPGTTPVSIADQRVTSCQAPRIVTPKRHQS
jgi:hypothetical protein